MPELNITGRDAYITAQALYQACKYQESLKDSGSTFYEWSNHQDMKALLNEMFPHWGALFTASDQQRGVKPANLVDEKRRGLEEEIRYAYGLRPTEEDSKAS